MVSPAWPAGCRKLVLISTVAEDLASGTPARADRPMATSSMVIEMPPCATCQLFMNSGLSSRDMTARLSPYSITSTPRASRQGFPCGKTSVIARLIARASDFVVHALARFAHGADEGLDGDVVGMVLVGIQGRAGGEFGVQHHVIGGFQPRLRQHGLELQDAGHHVGTAIQQLLHLLQVAGLVGAFCMVLQLPHHDMLDHGRSPLPGKWANRHDKPKPRPRSLTTPSQTLRDLHEGTNQPSLAALCQAIHVGMGAHRIALDTHHAEALVGNELRLRHRAQPQATRHRLAQSLAAADLHHHAGRDAGLLHRLFQRQAGGRALLAHQHGLLVQLGQRHRFTLVEGMIAMHEQHHCMIGIGHRMEPRIVGETGQHGHIGHVVGQVGQRLGRVAQLDRQLHLGIAGAIGVHHLDHVERPDRADAQVTDMQRPRVDQQVQGIEFQFGNVLGDRQETLRGLGQVHPPPAPEEQLHVMFALQRLHLGGQRRLAHAQRPGRGGKAAMAGHGEEGAQLGGRHLQIQSIVSNEIGDYIDNEDVIKPLQSVSPSPIKENHDPPTRPPLPASRDLRLGRYPGRFRLAGPDPDLRRCLQELRYRHHPAAGARAHGLVQMAAYPHADG
eukprot:TRINITY_DN743_c1_g6_i1.p1 TRINITY_DN743_c1_g6~~TRINITY_DN743_c1_g6_i1.p1  ORF type:complete len:614 (+),score=166.64 TRINITY_DN743_c1_g6_i1:1162-3003(+)